MSRSFSTAVLGALAIGAAFVAEPAAAMPVAGLTPMASEAALGDMDQVRFRRGGFGHRGFGFGRRGFVRPGYGGYGYGYGYRHRSPVRRLLRRIL